MKTITVTRTVLEPWEREIRKTWGEDWKRMKKDQKKEKPFGILTGRWHGPTGSRIVHVEYVPGDHAKKIVLREVIFTDGTRMSISVETMSIPWLLAKGHRKKMGYKGLIDEARASCAQTYNVVGVKEEDAPPSCRSADIDIPDGDYGAVRVEGGEVKSVDATKVEENDRQGEEPEPWWTK